MNPTFSQGDPKMALPSMPGAARCTCPSGDGSLVWPCPSHPPESASPAVVSAGSLPPLPDPPDGLALADWDGSLWAHSGDQLHDYGDKCFRAGMAFARDAGPRPAAADVGSLPAVDKATVDVHLDAGLRAAGSALRHYSLQKTLDDMRAAMRAAMVRTTANGVGGHRE